jgi:uncharacterized protein YbaP (TraB family)
MKKKTIFYSIILISALITTFNGYAKDKPYLFYEIKSPTATVYLLGSIHLGKKEWYPMPQPIEIAFDKSDYLVTEIDINKVDVNLFMQAMLIEDSTKLKDKIKPENYKKLLDVFTKAGLNEDFLDKLRPWAAAIMYEQFSNFSSSNIDANYGVDVYFTRKANKKNLPIKGIETDSAQMSYLEKFHNFADDTSAINTKPPQDDNNQAEKLIDAWENGNAQELNQIINQIYKDYPKMGPLMDEILKDRNTRMVDTINNYLQDNKIYFVIVGAGHLVGQNGIINLLNKRHNLKVRRIK